MQKMSHVAKKFFIHTAGLFYQEEQNAAEKEFFQHNTKKKVGGSDLGRGSDLGIVPLNKLVDQHHL